MGLLLSKLKECCCCCCNDDKGIDLDVDLNFDCSIKCCVQGDALDGEYGEPEEIEENTI